MLIITCFKRQKKEKKARLRDLRFVTEPFAESMVFLKQLLRTIALKLSTFYRFSDQFCEL